MKRNVATILAVAVLVVVNTLLSLFRIVPEGVPVAAVLPGIELTLVCVVLCLLPAGWARRFAWFAAPIVVVLALYGVGEAFYRFVYRETMDPFRDLAFAGPFFAMVTGIERLSTGAVLVAAILPVGVLSAALAISLRRLIVVVPVRRSRRVNRLAAATVALLWALRVILLPPGEAISLVAVRGLAAGLSGAASLVSSYPPPADVPPEAPETVRAPETAQAPETVPPAAYESFPAPLERAEPERGPALGVSNVTILVIESYGHTLFSRADHKERIMPVYGELGGYLNRSGMTVYSAFVRSPAFGGRSWLADGTILSGEWLGNQELYDAVFSSPAPNLVRDLAEAGYRSAVYAPAMTYFDEFWFEFYPFDESYVLDQLGYRGPVFEFGTLTDQFLLWRVHQATAGARKLQPERPVFSFVMMVSSHVPFRLVPPFVDDWSSLGDGEIYNDLDRTWFDNNWLTGGEYPDGYTTSVAYSLRAALEYAVLFAQEDELVLVIGDHQPRIPISEQESTFSVPMHLLARDATLLAGMDRRGFTAGLVPKTDPEFLWMNDIYPLVMDVLTGVNGVTGVNGDG